MGLRSWLIEKLNPGQEEIYTIQGEEHPSTTSSITSVYQAYQVIPVVGRGVDLIVDSCSSIDTDIGDRIKDYRPVASNIPRPKKLETLLNFAPNEYINAVTFRANIFMDLLIDGNAFIYFDGVYLYNIPAQDMIIKADKVTFVEKYTYMETDYSPNEIIHIRDNSAKSIYRGDSRVNGAMDSINVMDSMVTFQKTFFDNNAIPGLVLKSPSVLSKKIKDRIIQNWIHEYHPKRGGRRPMILDGDLTIEKLSDQTFKELDFAEAIVTHETKILKSLGVPPVLIDSGNNANITPNLKLFYITTILPLYKKYLAALELFFGYDLKPIKQNIEAMKPELKDEANYYSTLANAGIITRNEAREKLRFDKAKQEFADNLILPANIAGSAQDATEGGRPTNEEES